MAITPTREQFSEFAHGERDGEVVMINLLHFAKGRARARGRPSRARSRAVQTPTAATARTW